jgi:hypothetical protein
VQVFDIQRALQEPEYLDQCRTIGDSIGEIHAAAFIDTERLLLAGNEEETAVLGIYSLQEHRLLHQTTAEETPGVLMPLGDKVVGFFEYPKMFDIATGRVLTRWPDLHTGAQNSSIIHHLAPLPLLALDPAHQRFAVVQSDTIVVIQF